MTTDATMKLALARMLPEVIDIHKDKPVWMDSGEYVRDTELDYLVRLAEAKLMEDQKFPYISYLMDEVYGHPSFYFGVTTSTWQQRTLALCKTKGIEV